MATIGTITVNLFTVDKDSVTYARAGHNVTHTDNVALNRTLPANPTKALRTNMRFERGFVPTNVNDVVEKPVTVSITCSAPPGIDQTAAKSYITEALTQAAAKVAEIAFSGDIHLD